MAGAAITIRRQVVTVDLRGTEADGLALQRRLPTVYTEVIAPALESALGRFATGAETLVIDRLQIDVPALALDRLSDGLAAGVREGVDACLLRAPPPSRVPRAPDSGGGSDSVERRTVAQTVDDALIAFLATGRLPWSFRLPPGRTLEQEVTDAWAGNPTVPGARSRILGALAAPVARLRLRLQFGRAFVLDVIREVAPPLASGVDEVLSALNSIEYVHESTTSREVLAARVIAAALADDPAGYRPTASALVRRALLPQPGMPAPPSRGDPLRTLLERRWPGASRDPASPEVALQSDGRPGERSPSTDATGAGTPPAAARPGRAEGEAGSAEPGPPCAGAKGATPGIEDVSEGIMVADAGIVLLHPFLPQLFAGLGLAAEGQLLDPPRAIALLHHLAAGERTTPEHEVTLAKVLCGRPLDEPVPADVRLTKAEIDEATGLLRAVIGHWTALRGTSPDVLRLEFLRRPGILSSVDFGEWLVRVHTCTVDILLDQLPWGTSMITLPWMPHMLHVEWR